MAGSRSLARAARLDRLGRSSQTVRRPFTAGTFAGRVSVPSALDDPMLWRSARLAALERAGRRYKIVSTSSDASAWQAAALAGLAVFVSLPDEVPEGLRPARPDDGLPELPEANLLLLKAREPRQPVTDALYAHIIEGFEVKTDVP